jgi:two-component system, response regulator PdtaR
VAKPKDLEQRISRLEGELVLLQRISRAMSRQSTDLKESLQDLMSELVDYLKSDSALLYLVEADELVLVSSNRHQHQAFGNVRMRVNEGLTGWVAREKRLLAISREAYADSRFKLFKDLPEDKFEAFLSAPVIARGQVVGVLNIQHQGAHLHDGHEMEMLTTVGEMIGAWLLLELSKTSSKEFHPVNLVLSTNVSAA